MERFYEITDYPDGVTGANVLNRVLDGLGFRFYWSTEGLGDSDYSFRPSPDSRSVEEIVRHVWGLVNWVCISVVGEGYLRPDDISSVRLQILEMLLALRGAVNELGDERLGDVTIEGRPFWHILNGPIPDALTHVGQINSFRRLAGNPVPGANVFAGTPPSTKKS